MLLIVLVGLVLGVIWTIASYEVGNFSIEASTLYVQSLSVIATTSVVAVYLINIIRDEEEEEWRSEGQLMEDMTREVIRPAISVLEENIQLIQTASVNWEKEGGSVIRLLLPGIDADEREIERLQRHYPDVYKKMQTHYDKRKDLVRASSPVITTLSMEIEHLLENENIDISNWGTIDASYEYAKYIMNSDWPDHRSPLYDPWIEYNQDFRSFTDEIDADFEAFREKEEEYLVFALELESDLRDVREELREKYRISLRDLD